MTRMAITVLVLTLCMSDVLKASNCDHALTVATSQFRTAPTAHVELDSSTNDERCRVFTKQFIEAVTVRQAVSTCRESPDRQRALELLDGKIQIVNDRLAEQSCGG